MTTAASAAAILPRVHAALVRGQPRAIWRAADRHTRSLWSALAHVDSEASPPLPWESLSETARMRLSAAAGTMMSFLRGLAEVSAQEND